MTDQPSGIAPAAAPGDAALPLSEARRPKAVWSTPVLTTAAVSMSELGAIVTPDSADTAS